MNQRRRHEFTSAFRSAAFCLFLLSEFFSHASSLKPDESVIMYPALAKRVRSGWEIQLHGIVFEPERHRLMTRTLRRALGFDEEELTPAEMAIFNERSGFFLVDNERGKKFSVRLDGETFALGTSAANGHFQSRQALKTNGALSASMATNGILSLELSFMGAGNRAAPLELHCLEETGVSVISDIDDTIKVSEVLNRKALLRNTFCRAFRPVPGMAAVYRGWRDSSGVQFHYVSASPWQLYVPLSGFTRSNGFPAGTFQMKEFRVKDGSVLKLFDSPERYKLAAIEPLLRQFPNRQFVLVGDSGEKDPEAYGALARKYPGQVRHIFIRDVTGESGDAPRNRKAFDKIPNEACQVFKEPLEIKDSLRIPAPTIKAK